MTNNYLVVNQGTVFGTKTGRMASVVQGEVGKVLVIDIQAQNGDDFPVTGATGISAAMTTPGGVTTAVTGTISVANGGLSWDLSSGDVGTDGEFSLIAQFTLNGDIYKTHPVRWIIIEDPEATAVQNPSITGVSELEAVWLTAEKAATEAAADGEILQSDGTNSGGSGYLAETSLRKHNFTAVIAPTVNDDTGDGYAAGSYWIDTVGGAVYFCRDATLGAAVWDDVSAAGGIANIVEDATPQLGGNLDLNGFVVTGLVIGTDAQAFDAQLSDLAGLAVTDGNFIVGDGLNWVAESGATVRTSLGLGTLAEQNGTFSGGGTFASGGFTLTVPATGTAALLEAINVFTARQAITAALDLGTTTYAFDVNITPTANGNHAMARIRNGRSGSTNNKASLQIDAYGQGDSIAGIEFFSRLLALHDSVRCRLALYDTRLDLNAGGREGVNLTGVSIYMMGGRGTGTGPGGSVFFQTAPIGGSGSTMNTLVTAAEIDDHPTGTEETRLLLLDLSDGTMKRVSFDADDSGGLGFKNLRVPN